MTETNLPVRAVTLFSSGVAYVLHEGQAGAGEARVELTFRTAQINDVLKSLILLDSGGTVQPAVYPSQDPIERTLASFAVNVAGNLTQADLLRQLRGTRLKVETDTGEVHEGRLLGIETRKKREVLTLLTEGGMVAVELSRSRQIALLDERRDRELREALAVLAGSSDEARRTLTLGFSGESARTVRVGYITEAPLWKVSYRLVLPEDDSGKPYLQGWALVENTTDEDWNAVELSLISGRPISFIQDLYKPLYLTRPTIPIDTGEMPIPQAHAGAMDEIVMESAPTQLYASMAAPAPMMAKRGRAAFAAEELSASTTAQAAGEAKGELFAYEISTPVSLPRQQAAMIPIVSESAGGEKLSLYNADTDPRRPQNAVRLTNSTALHLKAGPVTVFDGGIYAGDALMDDVPPGDVRLLTYAVDLALEGERIVESQPQRVLKLRLKRGVLSVTFSRTERTLYRFSSKADRPRKVLVEHPLSADWRLTLPDAPAERTRTHYRFSVEVPAGGKAELAVQTERTDATTYQILDAYLDSLILMASGEAGTPALKETLEEVGSRRVSIQQLEGEAGARESELQNIHTEQERIRQNLGAVERGTPLHRRYLSELENQEDRLATLLKETQQLRESARAAQGALRAWLDDREI